MARVKIKRYQWGRLLPSAIFNPEYRGVEDQPTLFPVESEYSTYVQAAIDRLSDDNRALLEDKHVLRLTLREIADRDNLSTSTVHARLQAAELAFRRSLLKVALDEVDAVVTHVRNQARNHTATVSDIDQLARVCQTFLSSPALKMLRMEVDDE